MERGELCQYYIYTCLTRVEKGADCVSNKHIQCDKLHIRCEGRGGQTVSVTHTCTQDFCAQDTNLQVWCRWKGGRFVSLIQTYIYTYTHSVANSVTSVRRDGRRLCQ